jgi:hypothetical protein
MDALNAHHDVEAIDPGFVESWASVHAISPTVARRKAIVPRAAEQSVEPETAV